MSHSASGTCSADPLLSISIVCYQPDLGQLALMLRSLARSVQVLAQRGEHCQVVLVSHDQDSAPVTELSAQVSPSLSIQCLKNPANPGFGAGHNQAIATVRSHYHLVLNPDVVLQDTTLATMLDFARSHPEIVALSPEVRDASGKLQYLCKTSPAVLDLALRAFAPEWVKKGFAKRLGRYEYRELVDQRRHAEVELISGCFMLCRTGALQAQGFDSRYFLYFEDFALSRQLHAYGQLCYFPDTCIVHFGGHSAHKGLRHLRYFVVSAWRYFNQFGWKVW